MALLGEIVIRASDSHRTERSKELEWHGGTLVRLAPMCIPLRGSRRWFPVRCRDGRPPRPTSEKAPHVKPPSNGWTGGQYSVFRLLLASYLVPSFLAWLPEDPLRGGIGVVASLLLGMGLFDRTAAVTLALGLLPESALELRYAWWLLVVHVFLPGRPYGAWSRRHNPDPAGGWHMPDGMLRGVQALLVLAWIGELAGWRPDSVPLGGMLLLHVLAFDPAWIRAAARSQVHPGHPGATRAGIRVDVAVALSQLP